MRNFLSLYKFEDLDVSTFNFLKLSKFLDTSTPKSYFSQIMHFFPLQAGLMCALKKIASAMAQHEMFRYSYPSFVKGTQT
jgi:hypothetical protein